MTPYRDAGVFCQSGINIRNLCMFDIYAPTSVPIAIYQAATTLALNMTSLIRKGSIVRILFWYAICKQFVNLSFFTWVAGCGLSDKWNGEPEKKCKIELILTVVRFVFQQSKWYLSQIVCVVNYICNFIVLVQACSLPLYIIIYFSIALFFIYFASFITVNTFTTLIKLSA